MRTVVLHTFRSHEVEAALAPHQQVGHSTDIIVTVSDDC
jgi:hypothetical protein